MTDQREALKELILTTTEYLRAWGIEIPDELKQRDKREPGRKLKEETEDRIFKALKRRWRRQAQFLKERMELMHPDRKAVIAPPYDQIIEASFEDEDEFIAEMIRILKEAARNGFQLFGTDKPFNIDWTMVNNVAADWAKEHAGEFIKFIDKTTRQVIGDSVSRFVETPGYTLRDLMDDLIASAFSESRAYSIAVTETTKAYAASQVMAGDEMRKEYPDLKVVSRWYTNNDDLVCDFCGPLDGMEIVFKEEGFTTEEDKSEGIESPPLHPNCRCWIETWVEFPDTEAPPED